MNDKIKIQSLSPQVIEEIREKIISSNDTDSLDWSLVRTQAIFDLFYDDEEGEPDQAIRDVLTDLMHMAEHRGITHFDGLVLQAGDMFRMEREEWAAKK